MTMLNPCHPDETPRDDLAVAGLTVTDAVASLGCTRQAPSRPLSGKAGVSPAMAVSLKPLVWSNAAYWMRQQSPYRLAQESRRQAT